MEDSQECNYCHTLTTHRLKDRKDPNGLDLPVCRLCYSNAGSAIYPFFLRQGEEDGQ